ncbi:unnamed protein product, partial [Meganyctiphanes norvegica]
MNMYGLLFLLGLAALPCVLSSSMGHEVNLDGLNIQGEKWRSEGGNVRLPRQPLHPGANMTTPELIEAMGYPAEIHYVTTDDGYILEIHRIPHGKAGPMEGPQKVAFLHHPLLGSSADWVMNTQEEALGHTTSRSARNLWAANGRQSIFS